MKFRKGHDYVI